MSEAEKAEYAQKVKYVSFFLSSTWLLHIMCNALLIMVFLSQEQDQYKLEYATYLESLPEDERQEELMKTQSKKKKIEHPEVEKEVNNGKKANKSRSRKGSKKVFFSYVQRWTMNITFSIISIVTHTITFSVSWGH